MKTKTIVMALVVGASTPSLAVAGVCEDISAGGEVKITEAVSTEGCTATLGKDTVLSATGDGKITSGNHGVVIKLNGHKLTVKDLPIEFKGDFAIAVHGDDKATDVVTFTNVTVTDLSSNECKDAGKRVGTVLWKVKKGTLTMTAKQSKVRYGVVVGAPMPSDGGHHDPASLGTATIKGAISYCQGTWRYGKRPILAFERAVTWDGGEVESVGPCDFEDPTLVNLRDFGLPGGPLK